MPGATESPIDTFIQLNLNIILKYLVLLVSSVIKKLTSDW